MNEKDIIIGKNGEGFKFLYTATRHLGKQVECIDYLINELINIRYQRINYVDYVAVDQRMTER